MPFIQGGSPKPKITLGRNLSNSYNGVTQNGFLSSKILCFFKQNWDPGLARIWPGSGQSLVLAVHGFFHNQFGQNLMKSCVASQIWVGKCYKGFAKKVFCTFEFFFFCLQKYFSQIVACFQPLLAKLKQTIPPFCNQPPKQ